MQRTLFLNVIQLIRFFDWKCWAQCVWFNMKPKTCVKCSTSSSKITCVRISIDIFILMKMVKHIWCHKTLTNTRSIHSITIYNDRPMSEHWHCRKYNSFFSFTQFIRLIVFPSTFLNSFSLSFFHHFVLEKCIHKMIRGSKYHMILGRSREWIKEKKHWSESICSIATHKPLALCYKHKNARICCMCKERGRNGNFFSFNCANSFTSILLKYYKHTCNKHRVQ